MFNEENVHLPEKLLEKTQEIDNEARIWKETEMEKKKQKKQ